MRVWKSGERCRVTCCGRTVDAVVTIASSNGISLAVEFEAILANYAGMMPLLWSEEDDCFKTIVGDDLLVILTGRDVN